jgi:hypothetical protein
LPALDAETASMLIPVGIVGVSASVAVSITSMRGRGNDGRGIHAGLNMDERGVAPK